MIIHNPILTGSFTFNGTDVSSVTGSSTFSASFASSINSLNAATASLNSFTASTNTFTASAATTGSNTFVGNQVVTGSLNVSGSITTPGTLTAQTLVVQTITSSVDFVTGSTRFGTLLSNTHVFSGSVTMNPGGLFVSSSGRVGIGASNPSFALTVQADTTDMISWKSPSYEVGRLGLDTNNAHGAIFLYSSGSQTIQISAKSGAYTYFNAGNVGIGNTTPQATLHLGASLNTMPSATSIAVAGDTSIRFMGGSDGNANYGSYIAGTQYGGVRALSLGYRQGAGDILTMTITQLSENSGSVGIGTTSPSSRLHIVDSGLSTAFRVTDATNYTIVMGYSGSDNTGMISTLGSTAKLALGTNSTARLIINGSGNIGIGTSFVITPYLGAGQSGVLQVATNVAKAASGGPHPVAFFGSNDTTYPLGLLVQTITGATTGARKLKLQGTEIGVSPNDIVMQTDGGNVGIGTSNPGRKLSVQSTSTPGFFHNTTNVAGQYCHIWQLGGSETVANSSYYLYCDTDNIGVRVVIYGNGNIANVNNSYGAYSDIKLKENITDATPKLDDLLKVKIRNFNLKGDDKKQIGVVAQELEEIFPGLIEESDDTIKNEDGEYIKTGEKTKTVKYSVFIPMLIKAIQELKAEFDEYKLTHP